MTDQPEPFDWKAFAAKQGIPEDKASKWFPIPIDQPETITVPVEVLRRLHNAAARDAYQDGLDRRAPGGGMSDWPTFLARLREQAT